MILYRYENYLVADYDPWAECEQPNTRTVKIRLRKYDVIKKTPQGVWITVDLPRQTRKWISDSSRKRFAHSSIEDAKEAFLRRKARQIKICEARLSDARAAVRIMENSIIGCVDFS